MNRSIISLATLAVFLVMGGIAHAGQLTIPNSFTSGATASASAVNANFTAVETAVNDNDTRIGAIEATGGVTGTMILDGTITASDIATGAVTSNDIANSTITGTDISNSSITDVDILDEPGIDWTGSLNMQITATTWARISTYSVSITAPTSGYVHVTFSGYTYQYSATVMFYSISTSSICSGYLNSGATGNQNLSFSGVNYNGFSIQYVTSVNAGTTTFYPCAFKAGTGTSPYIQNGYMTAVFYPTRY